MNDIDRSWSGFYKFSGISQIFTAILLIAGVLIFQGTLSAASADRLYLFSKHKFLFQFGNGLFILSDIFGIFGVLGVYLSLCKLKKNLALVGAVLGILGLVLGIGLRFGVHSEIELAVQYYNNANENLQSNYVAVANVLQGLYDIGLSFANIILGAHGLILGVAMLAGVFSKKVAYLYIISSLLYFIGFIGLLFIKVFGVVVLLSLILTTISMILIGIRLYAIGRT